MNDKIFGRIDYDIRTDREASMPLHDAEEAVNYFCTNYHVAVNDVKSVFTDNKNNYNHLQITVEGNYDLPKESWAHLKDNPLGVQLDIEVNKKEKSNNIVKDTAKELGMTQKELAAYIKVSEDTLGKWARGVVDTPEWAVKMFELLKTEREFNVIKKIIYDNMSK